MSRSSKDMTLCNYFLETVAQDKKLYFKGSVFGAGLGSFFWLVNTSRTAVGTVINNSTESISHQTTESRSKSPLLFLVLTGALVTVTVITGAEMYYAWKTFPAAKVERKEREQRYKAVLDYKQGADQFLNEVRALMDSKQRVEEGVIQNLDDFKYTPNSTAAIIDKEVKRLQNSLDDKVIVDNGWKCVITQDILRDPVKANDGFFYERHALQHWYNIGKRNCVILRVITLTDPKKLVTNEKLQQEILAHLTYSYSMAPKQA